MTNTTSPAEFVPFSESTKLRLSTDRPARVFLTVRDLSREDDHIAEAADAAFEVVILDKGGYMEATEYTFKGKVPGPHSREITGLSMKTSGVYVIPKTSTAPNLTYCVHAEY